jgi:hypothetical protein
MRDHMRIKLPLAALTMALQRQRPRPANVRTCPLRHRAIDDCTALLHLLTHQSPSTKRKAMSLLLDSARKTEFQLWAENAPFEFKDDLKARDYRCNGAARCWYIVLDEAPCPPRKIFCTAKSALAGRCLSGATKSPPGTDFH